MLKEVIEYTDFNGTPQKFTAYFNISKPELMELQVSEKEGFDVKLQRIVDSENLKEMIETFQEILKISYGVKSDDGQRFIKNEEVWKSFEQSPAYEEMFMRLASDAGYAEKFVKAVIPNVDEMIARMKANQPMVAQN